MRIIIPTSNKKHCYFLAKYVPPLKRVLIHLSKVYEFKLPDELIFRAMRRVSENAIRCAWANAGYNDATGYYIGMDVEGHVKLSRRRRLNNIAHEAAHIAEAIKVQRWSHSVLWDEIYKESKKFMKGEK